VFFAFFTAFGIGANDVANAFATSVGSKALTIRKAMVIAAFCEFGGAVLLGGQVSETIRSGISNPECFTQMPAVLMWGMCCVCLAVGMWLLLATYLELPVSTTHSAVGGVIGFTIVAVGADCVVWGEETDSFPFVKGVGAIVLSWVFSPVLSGLVSGLAYFVTRYFVLRAPNSTERALLTYPLLVAFCVTVCVTYIVIKGAKGVNSLWGFDAEGARAHLAKQVCAGAGA
jgi:sodium-dependent phosphate transporter